MGFRYNDGYKPDTAFALQHFHASQTPVLAQSTTQHPMAPAFSTPLQHQYDPSHMHASSIVPAHVQPGGSYNLPAAQMPQGPANAPGPSAFVAEHHSHPLNAYQQMPSAHENVPAPVPSRMPGGPLALAAAHASSSMPGLPETPVHSGHVSMHHRTSSAGPGLVSLGSTPPPGLIPNLASFRQGNLFTRQMQDPTSDPAKFGHFPYATLQAPAPSPYTQTMHSKSASMSSYSVDPALQHAGFHRQLGPVPGPDRSGFLPSVTNSYYGQPHLQPYRYATETRSFSENFRPSDELNPAASRTRPPYLSEDYASASAPGYIMSSLQPAQTQSVNKTVPLIPALLSQRESMRPMHRFPVNGNIHHRPIYMPQIPAENPSTHQSSDDGANFFDERVNFKPTETKKNKRPKINKLAGDLTAFKRGLQKRPRVKAEELSFDETYAKFQEILGITVPRADIKKRYELVLQSPLEKYLFDFFVHKIAVFIDTFLVHEFFQVIVSELALYDETRMILDSMFCLSSLISQRMDPLSVDALCPYDYYQKCVYSVGKNVALDKAQDPDGKILARCLISTNLLCIYEMFFVAVDSVYVKGAGGILATIMSRTDKSGGILLQSPFHYTCFWATVVCDLILSLKLECPCTFSIEKMWRSLDPGYNEYDSYEAFLDDKTNIKDAVEDGSSFVVTSEKTTWWLHKVTFLFILINDFYNQYDVITQEDYVTNFRFYRWLALKEKIHEFEKRMPMYLKPLIFLPAAEESEFPKIFFKDEKTAVTAINFRLAKLLLHAAVKEKLHVLDVSLIVRECENYPHNYCENLAREVAGIMKTYDANMRIWPINIHSLRQASRFIEPSSPCFETLKNLTARVISVCQTRLNILDLLEDKADSSRSTSLRSFVET